MKTCYTKRAPELWKPCIADLVPASGATCGHWYIARINVPWEIRGKGYGHELLMMILEDADTARVALCLCPVATDGLTTKELIDWYIRHGFVELGRLDNPCCMVREPQ